jgi:hypothetical protein
MNTYTADRAGLRAAVDKRRDFHSEEYKQLRAEVLVLLTRLDTLLQYAVLASALAYAWICIYTFAPSGLNKSLSLWPAIVYTALTVPPVVVGLLGALTYSTWKRIEAIGFYLKELEELLGLPARGWEHNKKTGVAGAVTTAAWLALLLGCMSASLIIYINYPKPLPPVANAYSQVAVAVRKERNTWEQEAAARFPTEQGPVI